MLSAMSCISCVLSTDESVMRLNWSSSVAGSWSSAAGLGIGHFGALISCSDNVAAPNCECSIRMSVDEDVSEERWR